MYTTLLNQKCFDINRRVSNNVDGYNVPEKPGVRTSKYLPACNLDRYIVCCSTEAARFEYGHRHKVLAQPNSGERLLSSLFMPLTDRRNYVNK